MTRIQVRLLPVVILLLAVAAPSSALAVEVGSSPFSATIPGVSSDNRPKVTWTGTCPANARCYLTVEATTNMQFPRFPDGKIDRYDHDSSYTSFDIEYQTGGGSARMDRSISEGGRWKYHLVTSIEYTDPATGATTRKVDTFSTVKQFMLKPRVRNLKAKLVGRDSARRTMVFSTSFLATVRTLETRFTLQARRVVRGKAVWVAAGSALDSPTSTQFESTKVWSSGLSGYTTVKVPNKPYLTLGTPYRLIVTMHLPGSKAAVGRATMSGKLFK